MPKHRPLHKLAQTCWPGGCFDMPFCQNCQNIVKSIKSVIFTYYAKDLRTIRKKNSSKTPISYVLTFLANALSKHSSCFSKQLRPNSAGYRHYKGRIQKKAETRCFDMPFCQNCQNIRPPKYAKMHVSFGCFGCPKPEIFLTQNPKTC